MAVARGRAARSAFENNRAAAGGGGADGRNQARRCCAEILSQGAPVKGPAILLLHSLKRARNIVLALGLLLSLFQLLLILMARAYEVAGSFAQMAALMPPFMRELIGSSMASF